MSSRNFTPEGLLSSTVKVPVAASEYAVLRNEVFDTAKDYAFRTTPTTFSYDLKDITVTGETPDGLVLALGDGFNRFSVSAQHKTKPLQGSGLIDTMLDDTSMSIWLQRPPGMSNPQIELRSQENSVAHGRDKRFDILPFCIDKPIGELDYGEVGLALDFLAPEAGNRATSLADHRRDTSFTQIAHKLGDMLSGLATTWSIGKTYTSHDFSFSAAFGIELDAECGSRLEIDNDGTACTYRLTLMAPLDIGGVLRPTGEITGSGPKVVETFEFAFKEYASKRRAIPEQDTTSSLGSYKFTISSHDFAKEDLDAILLKEVTQRHDAVLLGHRALSLLQSDHQLA